MDLESLLDMTSLKVWLNNIRFLTVLTIGTPILLSSCLNSSDIDKKSIGLVPLENIQGLFERFNSTDSLLFVSEKRGNVLVIKNKKKAVEYTAKNADEILIEPYLEFIWDTNYTVKKLYVISSDKVFPLKPSKIKAGTTEDNTMVQEVVLPNQIKENLSVFFARTIGREIIAVDRKGFVAGANQLGKSQDGNILIQTID